MDFDFDFDFEIISEPKQINVIDICGLVKKMKSKERKMFFIDDETEQLEALLEKPPTKQECYKMLSVGGGFSSIGLIKYVAEIETITEMYISTFRIGRKQFDVLTELKDKGKLGKCFLITSQTQQKVDGAMSYNGTTYNYYEYICEKCKEYEWVLKAYDNHSKLILMQTNKNYYVVETSSNLNENPKMEQFSFENDKSLFDWYKKLFIELIKE